MLGALTAIGATTAAIGLPGPASGSTQIPQGTGIGVTYQVSAAAEGGARAYWTPRRMLAATAAEAPVLAGAPRGTPTAARFGGSPSTGALFYTTGGNAHFCTASTVNSTRGDLLLTAAHCVYGKSVATDIEYVPEYHDGKMPYGAWPVQSVTVTSSWQKSHDVNMDFAFLAVAPQEGKSIQATTGGLTLGTNFSDDQKIEVIGHNDTDDEPVRCATKSFRFRFGQLEFYCHGFWTGTSGGPWIIGYNAKTGQGTVFGVIGGYEGGGDYEWASYSPYFGSSTRSLYEEAEHQPAPAPAPSASPSRSPSRSPSPSPSPTPVTSSYSPAPLPPSRSLQDPGAVHLAQRVGQQLQANAVRALEVNGRAARLGVVHAGRLQPALQV